MILCGLLSNYQSLFFSITSHLSTGPVDVTDPRVFISPPSTEPYWCCLSNSRPAPVGQLSCCGTSVDGSGPSSWAVIGRWHPAGSWHQQQEHELLSASVSYSLAGDWKTENKYKCLHLLYNTFLLVGSAICKTPCKNVTRPSGWIKNVTEADSNMEKGQGLHQLNSSRICTKRL